MMAVRQPAKDMAAKKKRGGGRKGQRDGVRLAVRAEMRLKAIKLRRAGCSYQDISDQLRADGYPCPIYTAYYLVQEALAETDAATQKIAPKLRELEVETLNSVQLHIWPKVQEGDVPAARAVVQLSARRAKLHGLDAPVKVTPTNLDGTRPYRHETAEQNNARIRELAKEAGFEIVDDEVVEADGDRTEGR